MKSHYIVHNLNVTALDIIVNCIFAEMLTLGRARCVHQAARQSVRSVYTVREADTEALVVGVVRGGDGDKQSFSLTPLADKVNTLAGGGLVDRLAAFSSVVGGGEARYLGPLHPDLSPHVIAVGVDTAAGDQEEAIDLARESVRAAAGAGVQLARSIKVSSVQMDSLGDSQAAAEGATLTNWAYQQFKKEKKTFPELKLHPDDTESLKGWNTGVVHGSCQNLARQLMEAPANFLTPDQFCVEAARELAGLPVQVTVRDAAWARDMNMGSFLSVAAGSHTPPRFLEMHYAGAEAGDSKPVVLVGKGVTFDTGGISIKPSAKMDAMRADMGGAATVTATMKAVASLGLKVNLVALIPLTENMPGGSATKPGDVVTAMNGTTIQVDNTDAEGRLILADALCYADTLQPRLVLDVATLTGAMSVALGTAATGVFSRSSADWRLLQEAGVSSGDRVWRMPLWKTYNDKMKKSPLADLNNISLTPGGGSCTAAAFLGNFTSCPSWLHLDIAGVMDNGGGEVKYLSAGMSGRPTRTLVNFVQKLL